MDEPYIGAETFCYNGSPMGHFVYSYCHQFVLLLWWIPTFLGILLGEVILLYLSISHFPLLFIHFVLKRWLRELRPYNCANEFYESDFASPCLETMIVWSLTTFVIVHIILRNLEAGHSNSSTLKYHASRGNIILVVAVSIFITWALTWTRNNTWLQVFVGTSVGVAYGALLAFNLEYFWSYYIPVQMKWRMTKWFGYVDSVYTQDMSNCVCGQNYCRHRISASLYKWVSGVYRERGINGHQN